MEVIVKKCGVCGVEKPLCEFYPRKFAKDGHRNHCKECHKNKESLRYRLNKKEHGYKTTLWRKENKAKDAAYHAKYARSNPEKNSAKQAKRIAMKKRAMPLWANLFFVSEAYDLAKRRTAATGFKWEVDHIVPLKHDDFCGLHVEHNLQVIPATWNRAKNNEVWPEAAGFRLFR